MGHQLKVKVLKHGPIFATLMPNVRLRMKFTTVIQRRKAADRIPLQFLGLVIDY